MIVIAPCAILCGAERWVDVAERGEDNESWLRKYLELAHGTASPGTFSRVFRLLDARMFEVASPRLAWRAGRPRAIGSREPPGSAGVPPASLDLLFCGRDSPNNNGGFQDY
jgi:hypothetical protein